MMYWAASKVVLGIILLHVAATEAEENPACLVSSKLSEDGRLNFTELAAKYGQSTTEHDVTTEDGYILKVFRIPGNKTKPVFLMHGIFGTSDDFFLRGNNSLTVILANAGYDVWLGNVRGNRYSRRHTSLNPDTDKAFWDFSIDEHALLDLPVMLNLILNVTGAPQLSVVNFSQGSTVFFALIAAKPEYNNKIKIVISMAPICDLQYTKQPLLFLTTLAPILSDVLVTLGVEELTGYNSTMTKAIRTLCAQGKPSYDICVKGALFIITGADEEQMEPEFLPTLIGHIPAGTSRKNLLHFGQIANRRTFARFDYGLFLNPKHYNSLIPPVYDVSKITLPVALLVGKNDRVATIKIAESLKSKLPNVVRYTLVELEKWTHLDFTYGKDAYIYVYPEVLDLLKIYNN